MFTRVLKVLKIFFSIFIALNSKHANIENCFRLPIKPQDVHPSKKTWWTEFELDLKRWVAVLYQYIIPSVSFDKLQSIQVKPKLIMPLTGNSETLHPKVLATLFPAPLPLPSEKGKYLQHQEASLSHSNLDTNLSIFILIFSHPYTYTLLVPPNNDHHSSRPCLISTPPQHHKVHLQ